MYKNRYLHLYFFKFYDFFIIGYIVSYMHVFI